MSLAGSRMSIGVQSHFIVHPHGVQAVCKALVGSRKIDHAIHPAALAVAMRRHRGIGRYRLRRSSTRMKPCSRPRRLLSKRSIRQWPLRSTRLRRRLFLPRMARARTKPASFISSIGRCPLSMRDLRESYRTGMASVQQKRKEMFPGSASIAALDERTANPIDPRDRERPISSSCFAPTRCTDLLGNPSYGGQSRSCWLEADRL